MSSKPPRNRNIRAVSTPPVTNRRLDIKVTGAPPPPKRPVPDTPTMYRKEHRNHDSEFGSSIDNKLNDRLKLMYESEMESSLGSEHEVIIKTDTLSLTPRGSIKRTSFKKSFTKLLNITTGSGKWRGSIDGDARTDDEPSQSSGGFFHWDKKMNLFAMIVGEVKGNFEEHQSSSKSLSIVEKSDTSVSSVVGVVDAQVLLANDLRQMQLMAEEMVSTEKYYVNALKSVCSDVIRWLKGYVGVKVILEIDEIDSMFGSIPSILALHQKILEALEKIRREAETSKDTLHLAKGIPDVFIKYGPFLKIYNDYVFNFSETQNQIYSARKQNKEFDKFLTVFESFEDSFIDSYMIMPVQRIPRYELLLGGIQKLTRHMPGSEENTQFQSNLSSALESVKRVGCEIESSMEMAEARRKVVEVQEVILKGRDKNIVIPNRYCMRMSRLKRVVGAGPLRKTRLKAYLFVLFNDCLMVITEPEVGSSARIKSTYGISGMTVEDVAEDNGLKNALRIDTEEERDIVVCCPTLEEKTAWIEDLRNCIRKHYLALKSFQQPLRESI